MQNSSRVARHQPVPHRDSDSKFTSFISELSMGVTSTRRTSLDLETPDSSDTDSGLRSLDLDSNNSDRRRLSGNRGGGTRFRASTNIEGLKRIIRGRGGTVGSSSANTNPGTNGSTGSGSNPISEPSLHPEIPGLSPIESLSQTIALSYDQVLADLDQLGAISDDEWASMLEQLNNDNVTSFNAEIMYYQGRRLEFFMKSANKLLDMIEDSPELADDIFINISNLGDDVAEIRQMFDDRNDLYIALERRMLAHSSQYLSTILDDTQSIKDYIEVVPNLNINELTEEQQSIMYHKQRALLIFIRRADRDLDRLHRIDIMEDPFIAENFDQINELIEFSHNYFEENSQFVDDINNAQLERTTLRIQNRIEQAEADMAMLDSMVLDPTLITDNTQRANLLQQKRRLEIFSRFAGRDLDRIDLDRYHNDFIVANLERIDLLVDQINQHLRDHAGFYSRLVA